MAVVAHHPVVVELEGIACCHLTVDDDFPVSHFEDISFVGTYATLVDGQVVECQLDGLSLSGYPYRTIVVASPVGIAVEWVDVECAVVIRYFDALHQIFSLGKCADGAFCQRHISCRIERHEVFHGNT